MVVADQMTPLSLDGFHYCCYLWEPTACSSPYSELCSEQCKSSLQSLRYLFFFLVQSQYYFLVTDWLDAMFSYVFRVCCAATKKAGHGLGPCMHEL